MSGITASITDNSALGYYRIFAQAPGTGIKQEITFFRGAPISLGSLTHSDPFGDKSATINIPNVTIYDKPGSGDLFWLTPWSKIDVIWEPDSGVDSLTKSLLQEWSWEGVIASWSFSQDSSTGSIVLECVGALYILDNLLAIPFYPSRPIPFEVLIERIFKRANSYGYGLGNLVINYDPNECLTYHSANYRFGIYNPAFLNEGQLWSGFAGKQTGSKDKALTSFISSLISQMYSTTGKQWTLMNRKNRMSELYVKKYRDDSYINNANPGDTDVLYIDAVTPGVTIRLNQDFSQTANVIYGSGTTPEGRKYYSPGGNAIYTPQIQNTTLDYFYYEQNPQPFAFDPAVQDKKNDAYKYTTRKELSVDFVSGLDALQATEVAKRKLELLKEPGYSGTITLSVDVELGSGFVFPRYLIEAGKTLVVYFGNTGKKSIFNISEASLNIETGEVSLTVDTKNKDLITVEEVRARRGDSLNMVRRLGTTMKDADIPQADYLRPWHGEKSGKMPKTQQSLELFRRIEQTGSVFPWTDVTTAYTPENYPDAYVKIGPADTTNPSNNWHVPAVPILLSSRGTIGTTQIAAYRKDGTLFPAEFHISFYLENGVGTSNMPGICVRLQNFTTSFKSARWVPEEITGSTAGYVELVFDQNHGLTPGSGGWKISPSGWSGNWAPATSATAIISGSNTIMYRKTTKPTGTSPTNSTVLLEKKTFPRQRASLGKDSAGVKYNFSGYKIIWDSTAAKYKVSISVPGSIAVDLSSKIKLATKSYVNSLNDKIYGNANSAITVSGATTNTAINGSFTTTVSTEKGTIDYYINSTSVISGEFVDDITVEIDIATTGGDLGNYNEGSYPFFEWAFQNNFEDGTPFDYTSFHDSGNVKLWPTNNPVMGWGTYWQPAGYGAGLASEGAPKTGTLIDESGWQYDTLAVQNGYIADLFDVSSVISTIGRSGDGRVADNFGYVYAMIYCDDQGPDDIYFLGRMYPGGEQI